MKTYSVTYYSKRITALLLMLLTFASFAVVAETFTLNFKDADIKELIKFVADSTGYTVIVDPKVKGNIQVISKDPVDEVQLYDLFLQVLSAHGYAAVKNGNILRIIPDKTARTSPIPVVSSIKPVNAEFVTHVVELENVSATKLIPVLRPLVPQQGHMAAYADTNVIILSDTKNNVAKILAIIARIDKSSHQETEIVRLQHASADEIVRVLTQIIKKSSGSDKNPSQTSITMVADSRSNSVIVSGTQQARARVLSLIAELDTALEAVGNAKVFFLHHANAKELSAVLSKVSQNMAKLGGDAKSKASASKVATIEADEATNALIITAQADVMEGLKAIIDQLDVPRAQVLVEAIIVEVQEGNNTDLGFDLLVGNEHGGFGGSNFSSGLAGQVALGAFDEDADDSLIGVATAIAEVPGALWGGADFDVGGTSFAAVLTALQGNSDTNILSTPSLMTLDNNEASIIVGQEVPFITGSYTNTGSSGATAGTNPFQTINRENVGITLKVTPHVNDGGQITLEIIQEVSNLASSTEAATADVVTNERKIETTVTTKNGETIVLGGLIQDDLRETVVKVPILGDIPIIGRLFKRSSTSIGKTNLMVFIKPTIVSDPVALAKVTEDRYQSIRNRQLQKKVRGVDLYDESVLQVLPEWQTQVDEAKRIQQQVRQESEQVEENP